MLKTIVYCGLALLVAAQSGEDKPPPPDNNVIYQGPPVIVIPEGGGGCGSCCNQQPPPPAAQACSGEGEYEKIRDMERELRDLQRELEEMMRAQRDLQEGFSRDMDRLMEDVRRFEQPGKNTATFQWFFYQETVTGQYSVAFTWGISSFSMVFTI